jgi:thiol-disulfide isomerase/thioredoxin
VIRHALGVSQRPGPSDYLAAIVTLVIGGPLLFAFASALADGEVRRQEAPLRALLGPAYDELVRGRPTEEHYLGDDRLAPDFELEDLEGRPWRLSERRGRVVVMNFWTITCGPCVEEMPTLVELARMLEGRTDVELVTVTIDRRPEDVRAVIPSGTPLRVLMDRERTVVRERYGTVLFPETWIVDAEGVIRMRVDGAREWSSAVALDAIESFL